MKLNRIAIILISTLAATAPTLSQAFYPRYCGTELISSNLRVEVISYDSNTCTQTQPLSLVRRLHHFPLLGELTVDVWGAEFTRIATVRLTTRWSRLDCFGSLIDTWTESEVRQNYPVRFEMDNPNLHDDVKASYLANAPMTDAESKVELTQTLKRCEEAHLHSVIFY